MSGEAPDWAREEAADIVDDACLSETQHIQGVPAALKDAISQALTAVDQRAYARGIEEAAKVCSAATRASTRLEKQSRESGNSLRAEFLASGAYASSSCERAIRQLLEVKG